MLELKNVVFRVISTIFAVVHKVYGSCYQNMVLDLNAGDDMGIDAVQQQVQDFSSTYSISFRFVGLRIAIVP